MVAWMSTTLDRTNSTTTAVRRIKDILLPEYNGTEISTMYKLLKLEIRKVICYFYGKSTLRHVSRIKLAFWPNFPFLSHFRKVNVHHDRYLLISILPTHLSLCGFICYLIKYKFATNNDSGVSQTLIYFYHRNSPINESKRATLKGGPQLADRAETADHIVL